MKTKKIPMRMCVGCKQMKPKKELVRIVLPKDGEFHMDPTGRENGRGAYICRDENCLNAALKQKNLKIPKGILEDMKTEILNAAE